MVLRRFMSETGDRRDPIQFAYARNQSTEDAILTLLHNLYDHLEKSSSYTRIICIDFHGEEQVDFNVNPILISWIFSFLTRRTQRVSVGCVLSDGVTTNTCVPQSCVLSLTLFTLYTADCHNEGAACLLIRNADVTLMSGLIPKNDESEYRRAAEELIEWCDDYPPELNVTKTKELVVIQRGNKTTRNIIIIIKGEPFEMVDSYKQLRTTVDNLLDWTLNVKAACKGANQPLF